jgi:hypothetical protein
MAEMAEICGCDGVMARIDANFELAVFRHFVEGVGL